VKMEGPHPQEPNRQCPKYYDGGCERGPARCSSSRRLPQRRQESSPTRCYELSGTPSHNEVVGRVPQYSWAVTQEDRSGGERKKALRGSRLQTRTLAKVIINQRDAFNVAASGSYSGHRMNVNHVNLVTACTDAHAGKEGEIVGRSQRNGVEHRRSTKETTISPGGGAEQSKYATYTWNLGDGSPKSRLARRPPPPGFG